MFRYPRHETLWRYVVSKMIDTDLAHDHEHVLRVYRWCLKLAEEAGADKDLAGAAGLIHDLVNVPKESADRPMGSEWSAIAGANILPECGYSPEETQQIVDAVATCSWSRGLQPRNAIGVTLQHADRLDAIGAIGIMRNIACAQAMSSRGTNGRFYEPTDPTGRGKRQLNDKKNALDHFSLKLLRLKEGMHLPSAVAEADKRHAFLLRFLSEVNREWTAESEE